MTHYSARVQGIVDRVNGERESLLAAVPAELAEKLAKDFPELSAPPAPWEMSSSQYRDKWVAEHSHDSNAGTFALANHRREVAAALREGKPFPLKY